MGVRRSAGRGDGMNGRRVVTTISITLGIVLVVALALAGWRLLNDKEVLPEPAPVVTPSPPAPAAVPTPSAAPAPERLDPCTRWPRRSFVPDQIIVRGVTSAASVLPLPRDGRYVPGVPPTSDKTSFAWDLGGVEPGSTAGHVLLNTHTWPDGSASGNLLLDGLDVGGRLVMRGEGRAACYEVTRRVEVPVEDGYPGWDADDGPPEVVIVVCSGVRRGPGDWSHRTLWFAEPVGRSA
jgi:hypothetical protein